MSAQRPHWSPEALRQQIELGEDSQFELKEAFFEQGRVTGPRKERVANELAAFANARGGTLVFSVADDGTVRDMSRNSLMPWRSTSPTPARAGLTHRRRS